MLLDISNELVEDKLEHIIGVYLLVSDDDGEHELIRVFVDDSKLLTALKKAKTLMHNHFTASNGHTYYAHKCYVEIDNVYLVNATTVNYV